MPEVIDILRYQVREMSDRIFALKESVKGTVTGDNLYRKFESTRMISYFKNQLYHSNINPKHPLWNKYTGLKREVSIMLSSIRACKQLEEDLLPFAIGSLGYDKNHNVERSLVYNRIKSLVETLKTEKGRRKYLHIDYMLKERRLLETQAADKMALVMAG